MSKPKDELLEHYEARGTPVQTEQEQQAALDRVFWLSIRQALLMAVSAIERRYDIKPTERTK